MNCSVGVQVGGGGLAGNEWETLRFKRQHQILCVPHLRDMGFSWLQPNFSLFCCVVLPQHVMSTGWS